MWELRLSSRCFCCGSVFFGYGRTGFCGFRTFYACRGVGVRVFRGAHVPFHKGPTFILSRCLLFYFFHCSVSRLVACRLVFVSKAVVKAFLMVATRGAVVFILVRVSVAVVFIALFVVYVIYAMFTTNSLRVCFSSLYEGMFLPTILLVVWRGGRRFRC